MSTAYLLPIANGTYTDFALSGCTNAWECIDDPVATPDDNTTSLGETTANSRQSVTLQAYTSFGSINSVTVTTRSRRPTTAAATIKNFVRVGGVNYDGAGQTVPVDTAYYDRSEVWTTNPATSAAWLVSELQALEAGLLLTVVGGASAFLLTQLYATISYEPPYYQVNSGEQLHGVRSEWQRVVKRRNADGSIDYQNYALSVWEIGQMEMASFLALQALSGQVLTSLRTTSIEDRNTFKTYTSAEIVEMVNTSQIGRRATSCRVTFRVDIT